MARESSHHARIGGARIARLSRSTVRRGGSARGSRCRPASDFRPVMSAARISCNKKAPSRTAALPRTARERVVGILECGDGGVREAVRPHLGLERRKVARHREVLAALALSMQEYSSCSYVKAQLLAGRLGCVRSKTILVTLEMVDRRAISESR